LCFKFELMTIINVFEYLSVQAREPSRAGSRAYIEPSRASLPSSISDRAEPGSARYSTEPHPGSARLVSSPNRNKNHSAWSVNTNHRSNAFCSGHFFVRKRDSWIKVDAYAWIRVLVEWINHSYGNRHVSSLASTYTPSVQKDKYDLLYTNYTSIN
jgi:hypothetical protein